MPDQVYRKEKKFLLSQSEKYLLHNRLESILHRDANCPYEGYMVRSLYFDSIRDTDFFEKADGINLRRKIRLRIYDPNAKSAKLEMKQKEGDQQKKRSLTLSRQDALRLIQGDYEVLHQYATENPIADEFYGLMSRMCYRPKTIVQYTRLAYTVPTNDIRITLDDRICATESSMDFFDEKLNLNPVMDLDLCVLEVKYNHFLLGYVKQILESVDRSEVSVSKYVLARAHGYRTHL